MNPIFTRIPRPKSSVNPLQRTFRIRKTPHYHRLKRRAHLEPPRNWVDRVMDIRNAIGLTVDAFAKCAGISWEAVMELYNPRIGYFPSRRTMQAIFTVEAQFADQLQAYRRDPCYHNYRAKQKRPGRKRSYLRPLAAMAGVDSTFFSRKRKPRVASSGDRGSFIESRRQLASHCEVEPG